MPLTETRLRALKPKDKPYKVADDRGLYIEVSPSGGKLWRFRYRIGARFSVTLSQRLIEASQLPFELGGLLRAKPFQVAQLPLHRW